MKAPTIAGKYTLLRRLGHGGMAEVFLARQGGEGGVEKLVVLKRILPHLANSSEFVAMFLDEARLAADLRHPNVVTILDVGKTSETYFIAMEFLHGQDVRKVQRKVATFAQMVPLAHACQIAIDAAAGLHYAHTKKDLQGRPLQVVHRDVSPQNILVTFEGATKIVDFGIAKAAGQSSHTSTGVLKGKYTYMSPEQADAQPVDARTDQFALGIVLWELLTMRRLFKRETEVLTLDAIIECQIPRPRRFRDDVPTSIEDVVMTALAKDRKNRFRDCQEFALALEDALSTESIVHSQSRLSQYLRKLFADQLAEEASLGVVNPDGSLTTRNTFPIAGNREKLEKADKPAKSDKGDKSEAPRDAFAELEHEAPAAFEKADATQADRKSARSKTEDRTVDKPRPTERSRAKDRTDEAAARPPRSKVERTAERAPEHPSEANAVVEVERPRDARASDARGDRQLLRLAGAALVAGAVSVLGVGGYLVATSGSGRATLVVRSEPRGAAVWLDGVKTTEITPALLREVSAGEAHKVHLELDGYQSADEIVTIPRKGMTQELRLDLVRR